MPHEVLRGHKVLVVDDDPRNAFVLTDVLEMHGMTVVQATDGRKAAPGTIRADFADSIDANAVHGSDAAETAQAEVAFFFPGLNIYSR